MVLHQIVSIDLKSGSKDDLVQALKELVLKTKVIKTKGEHKGGGGDPPLDDLRNQTKIPYPKPELRLMSVRTILYRYISLSLKVILVC